MDLADPGVLVKLANMKMPFGKYEGMALIDLPEPYVVWFYKQGLPSGELGTLMAQLYEIKLNGLEDLVRPFKAESRLSGSRLLALKRDGRFR